MLLKKLFASVKKSPASGKAGAAIEYPLEIEQKLYHAHGRAPVERHLDILLGDYKVGGEKFTDLYTRCLHQTGTVTTPFNVFQRFQTRLDLVKYFLATLDVPGARVECGAYRGATALLLCHAWRSRQTDFRGADFHLIDSFSGTGASVEEDYIPVRGPDGDTRMEPFFPAGKSDVSPEMVRNHFRDFPEVEISAGWIPDVFAALPEKQWAFVHIDLTLYQPTLAALNYFYPRLSPGGVIICAGSVFCPGMQIAWDEFSAQHDAPYVTLASREYALIK
jgi:O-methyltransferase